MMSTLGDLRLSVPKAAVYQCRMTLLRSNLALEDPDRIDLEKALAGALVAMHDISHDLSELEEAISLYERILDTCPVGPASHVRALTGLGNALWRWCEFHDEDTSRLRRSIDLLREALDLCLIEPAVRADTLHALGLALHTGFEQLGDPNRLLEAVSLHREALRLRPMGHPLRDDSLSALASVLFTQFVQQGGLDLLAEVIDLHHHAIPLRPPGHPRRDKSLNNLAIAMQCKFEQLGGRDILSAVISLNREVLALRPAGSPLRAHSLNNLAGALCEDFEYHGSFDALAESVDLGREGLLLRPPGHPLRSSVLQNLANSLHDTFLYQGSQASLSEAIALHREALLLRPSGHMHRDDSLYGLGIALETRGEYSGSNSDLEESISLHREALQLRPFPLPLSNDLRHQLAATLAASYQPTFTSKILDGFAVSYCEAMEIGLNPHPSRHISLMGLISSLLRLATKSNDIRTCKETVTLCGEALALCPKGHTLRAWFKSRLGRCLLISTSPVWNFDLGVEQLTEGLSDGFAPVHDRLRDASEDLLAVEKAYGAAMSEAHAPAQEQRRRHILGLYQLAIQLLPRMANFGMDHLTRYRLLRGTDEISRNAASRALLLGCISEAVEMLEAGRGLFWTQALRLRTSELDDVPEADRVELQRLFYAMDHGAHGLAGASSESAEQREKKLENQRQLNIQAETLIARIRSYSGLQRFLMPAAFDAILQSLPNGFIIMVNASFLGCHALLLSRDGAVAKVMELPLPRSLTFDSATIRASLPRDANYITWDSLRDDRAMRVSRVEPRAFEDLLATLWTSIVSPIIRRLGLQRTTLRARPRVWWCVTGELGFMPLHAAGNYRTSVQEGAVDFIVSSYVPTLSALTKAHTGWQPVAKTALAGLLVCESSAGLLHLPNVAEEVNSVRECFQRSSVKVLNEPSEHTTVTEMQRMLERYTAHMHILHLASHGVQETNALDSAFLLQDGRLSIADIMRLRLPCAMLAFLSACQTAKGDHNAPDQAVHLAASMLFCGFRSVVGTLWLMHDEDGPRIAQHFYDRLLETDHLDLDDIPYALDSAVGILRNAEVPASRWSLFVHMGG